MTNTLFIGKVYYRFDELPSTNDWAAELLAKSKPPEGMVVRADTQTAGRGQFGSRWESNAGQNLLLSILLYPNWLAVKDQFYLSMAVSLALYDLLNDPAACSIKWPNDLYLGKQKTAGVLIQNTIQGAMLQSSIVGIGLNVNQLAFSPDLPNPCSLAQFYGKSFDLDKTMEQLFLCLERRYLQLKSGRLAAIKHAYEAALFQRAEKAQFERTSDGSHFYGTPRGVSPSGHLQVDREDGQAELFDLKQLRWLL